jgi:hypothetical protein
MKHIARWLRRLADRIDRGGAPKLTHWSFTFEEGEGIRFREDGRGCPVAYLGDDDYGRAHTEAGPVPFPERMRRFVAAISAASQELHD